MWCCSIADHISLEIFGTVEVVFTVATLQPSAASVLFLLLHVFMLLASWAEHESQPAELTCVLEYLTSGTNISVFDF